MKNKGYYGWIHSLNAAGVQAQQKGNQMLNEAKASKITNLAKQAELAKKLAPVQQKPMADESETEISSAIMPKQVDMEISPDTIELADGDAGAFVNIRMAKEKEALAAAAAKKGPINLKPAGTANQVKMDAADGVMADPEFVPGPDRVHPEPWYKTPEEAHQAVKGLNTYYNQPDEDDDDEHLSIPTADWKTFKESVNQKVRRILGT